MAGNGNSAVQLVWLLCALMFLSYARCVEYGFVADDGTYLGVRNNFLVELPTSEVWRIFVAPTNPWEFLPVRDLSYWFDAQVFGLGGEGFHLMNLVWYALSCAAAYFALRETLRLCRDADDDADRIWAAIGTLMFVAHPAHVEAVAWISGRKDILAGLFAFLAWGWMLRSERTGWRAIDVVIVLGCAVFACLSKSPATATVMILVTYVLTRMVAERRSFDSWLLGRVALAASLALIAASTLLVHSEIAASRGISIVNDPGWHSMIDRGSRILVTHAIIMIAPVDLRLFHDVYVLGEWHWSASAVIMLASVWALVAWGQTRAAAWASGVFWAVVPLIPYLQLRPFTTWSMASERFVFQASFGVVILAVLIGRKWQHVGSRLALLAFAVALGAASHVRIGDWQIDSKLFLREALLNPGHYIASRHLAITRLSEQDYLGTESAIAAITRVDAREAMQAWYRHRRRVEQRDGEDSGVRLKKFCASVLILDRDLARHFETIRHDPDIPLSNLLNNIVRGEYPGRQVPRQCHGNL